MYFFEPIVDDDPITEPFYQAQIRAKQENFTPILIVVDEALWEALIISSDEESDGDENYNFSAKTVFDYRQKALAISLNKGKKFY